MTALITDADLKDEIIARRQAAGSDRWDEVWNGVYNLMPLPNDEHQGLVGDLTAILQQCVEWKGLGLVRPGVNMADRVIDWKDNYRCPDVAVFLEGTTAENHDTFWYGGPDFAVEVVSPNDRSREKLDFYASIGVRELLLVDRNPWTLELFRLHAEELRSAGRSTPTMDIVLRSDMVPLTFRLLPTAGRPSLEVVHHDGHPSWTV